MPEPAQSDPHFGRFQAERPMSVERGVRRIVIVVSLGVFVATLGMVTWEKVAFRRAIAEFRPRLQEADKQLDEILDRAPDVYFVSHDILVLKTFRAFNQRFPTYQGWQTATLGKLIVQEAPEYELLFEIQQQPGSLAQTLPRRNPGATIWARQHMLRMSWGVATGISIGLAAVPWGLFFLVHWIIRGFQHGPAKSGRS